MEAICARIPEEEKLMINTSRSVAAVGLADLGADCTRHEGGDAEIGNLNRAVELQDKLGYMEPPEWHYSMREALGAALLDRESIRSRNSVSQGPGYAPSEWTLLIRLNGSAADAEKVSEVSIG